MKNILYFCIVIIIVSTISCKKTSNYNIENSDVIDSVFINSLLKKKIEKMVERIDDKEEFCSVLILSDFKMTEKEDKGCFAIVTLTIRINPDILTGYTYVDNKLVACYIASDLCGKNIINKERLITFKDSVSGYSDILKPYLGNYDGPSYTYKIISNDSLQLVHVFDLDL